jgi:hypothetical protein
VITSPGQPDDDDGNVMKTSARVMCLGLAVAICSAVFGAATAAAAPGQVIQCSDFFGPDVRGVIVFTQGGTPNVFTCRGGIFGEPPRGDTVNIACSDFFGPDVQGRIIFTRGEVSVFTCSGGPFGSAPTVFELPPTVTANGSP